MLTALALAELLRAHVVTLSSRIGERNASRPAALAAARDYVRGKFAAYGYKPELEAYEAGERTYHNITALLQGSAPGAPILVIGAHYDSAEGTPGADDNASGVAGLLELSRLLRKARPQASILFAAFGTEEEPYYGTEDMGSHHVAARLRAGRVEVKGMICLEMIGYYRRERESQSYPPFLKYFYPKRGNFISLIGDRRSKKFLARLKGSLRRKPALPIEAASLPAFVPGVDFSDHRNFWKQGWPAVMVTDTAFYRNPHYHLLTDTHERLDYEAMAKLVEKLAAAIQELAKD
ncbi:MAG: M28 family peptidase [Elusimicrobia bacterium]|nr:M28 family peptidase [Elusimicrobiota bacterium]